MPIQFCMVLPWQAQSTCQPLLPVQSGRSNLGHPTNLAASLALVAAMTPRAIRTRKLWPAGVMALLGWASSGYEAKKTLEWLG